MCSDTEIFDLLSQNYFNEAAVLVQAALQNGGADNVTCIVLEVLPVASAEESWRFFRNATQNKKHTYFKDTCAFLLTVFVIESKILGTGFRA